MAIVEQIIKLRKEGKSYNHISNVTGYAKSVINYHCKKYKLNGRIDGKNGLHNKNVSEIKEYYKEHTAIETARHFNVSISSIKRVVDNKRVLLTNKERSAANYRYVKKFRKQNKKKAVEYKGGKCERCGYNKCISALDFHHLNPKKKNFAPSENIGVAWDKLKSEIDKCILICANCHRETHFKSDVKCIRRKNKQRAIEYKGSKCYKCSYDKCISAFDFHHLNPVKKEFNLSKRMNISWNRLKTELDKCILICANCHREEHA